jgi:hypothetical protein
MVKQKLLDMAGDTLRRSRFQRTLDLSMNAV